jgi:hypothetical protein
VLLIPLPDDPSEGFTRGTFAAYLMTAWLIALYVVYFRYRTLSAMYPDCAYRLQTIVPSEWNSGQGIFPKFALTATGRLPATVSFRHWMHTWSRTSYTPSTRGCWTIRSKGR